MPLLGTVGRCPNKPFGLPAGRWAFGIVIKANFRNGNVIYGQPAKGEDGIGDILKTDENFPAGVRAEVYLFVALLFAPAGVKMVSKSTVRWVIVAVLHIGRF